MSAEPRGSLRLLADPQFGPYVTAKLVASTGVWIHNVVSAIVVYQITRSALMVGLVTIAQFAPQVVLAPLAGALADRGNRRVQLAVGRGICAVAGATLAVWIGVAGLDGLPGPWPVVGTALVVGVGFAVSVPAMHALLPALVDPRELPAAVALDALPFTIARAAGPALGALALAFAGPAVAFGISAVANTVLAAVVLRVRLRPMVRDDTHDRSVRAAFRYLRTDRAAALLLGGVTAIGLGVDPVLTLTPPLADRLGGGEELVGALASAFGAGAALSILFLGSVRRRLGLPTLAMAGLGLMGVGMAALAAAGTPLHAVLALGCAGTGMMFAVTALTTQLQQRVPEDLRGRVMALWSVCFVGSRPLAAAINGVLADGVSVRAALVVNAVMLLASAVLLVWLPRRGGRGR